MVFPLLVALLGLLAAFLPVALGFPDPPDAVPLGLLALSAGWAAARWRRRRTWGRLAAAVLPLAAFLALAAWMFGLSGYSPARGVPDLGEPAPAITATRVRDNAPFDLRAERGQAVLLVFFRGPW